MNFDIPDFYDKWRTEPPDECNCKHCEKEDFDHCLNDKDNK